MKTVSTRKEDAEHEWYVVNAEGKTLGRLSAAIASRLRGKHKAAYTPHVDTGDYIVVVNARHIRVTGQKETQKTYYRHTGYPGGIKSTTLGKLREEQPEQILAKAVKGMLPRNPLGRAMYRKLRVYAGPEHPHASQNPQPLEL